MAEHLHLVNYGPVYYFSFLFGILPFKCDKNFLFVQRNCTGSAFVPSFVGRLITYVFLVVNIQSGVFVLNDSITASLKYDSCFDEVCSINLCRNVCAHFTILWMNYLANVVSSVSIFILRTESTLDCLNGMNNVLRMRIHKENLYPAAWSVLFFIVVHWLSFYFHWKNAKFSLEFITNYLPLYLTQCLPIVTENMISVLLLLTQNCYADMNEKIEFLKDRRFFLYGDSESMKNSLKYLKNYHWETTDIAERISQCFGLDFFFAGLCSTIRFIYFLFLTLKYMAEQKVINEDGGLVLPSYQAIVFFIAVVGKFYYLCYRCDCVVAEARRIIPNLHALQNKLRAALDDDNEQQVNEFLNYVKCRQISFSACSFFTLDLHLIRTVFGLTITYFIVLMQFQASHHT